MKRTKAGVLGAAVLGVCVGGVGCNSKLLDPSQIGRFGPTPAINVILDSLGVAEETPMPWEAAEDPRPNDIVSEQGDYVLCRGDMIRVSILELYAENQMVTNDYVINESGRVSLPEVGVMQAAGLTETQLEEAIRKILSPNILKNPSVSVAMLSSEQRTFSVIGDGVDMPGRHMIPRNEFRLTDALAMARGPRQFNVSNIYVSRPIRPQTSEPVPSPQGLEGQTLQDVVPAGKDGTARLGAGAPAAQEPTSSAWGSRSITSERALVGMVPSGPAPSRGQGAGRTALSSDFPKAYGLSGSSEVISPSSFEGVAGTGQRSNARQDMNQGGANFQARQASRSGSQADVGIDWVFRDGRWIPVAAGTQGAATTQDLAPPQMNRVQADRPAELSMQSAATDRTGTARTVPDPMYPAGDDTAQAGNVQWMFRNGRWVPVLTPVPVPSRPQAGIPAPYAPRPSQRQESMGAPEGPSSRPSYDLPRTQNAPAAPSGTAADNGVEWVFRDGRWLPVQRGAGPDTIPQQPSGPSSQPGPGERIALDGQEPKTPEGMTWEEAVRSRLIRIPTDKLLAGDPRYNIVVQPGDTIHVPVDIVGECCITGNVNRAGYINITGRPMTLKMAIAAAGGLGPLAYPKKCEVVRRIGDKREEIVLVDLDRIASGEQPDFFIKPNDLINVGTHYTSRWRAVLRNAFRATYGFGFVYDRNFADADYGAGWPHWLTHWF